MRDEGNVLLSIRAETFASMLLVLLHDVDPRELSYTICDRRKEILVREFRFQILSRPIKVPRTGRTTFTSAANPSEEISNRECALSSRDVIFSH